MALNQATGCPHCDLLVAMFATIIERLDKIMSEDAAVQAVVADENTEIQNLTASVGSLQSLIQALQAEVAAGTQLQPGTLAALQQAQAQLDSLAATVAADVAADQPPAPAS